MAEVVRITARQRAILSAIIQSYVATGEPVGSTTVSRLERESAGMSSATIRNEMAALAGAGLLEQPHTSAGRIPTARAFRLYVEDLSDAQSASPTSLPEQRRQEIDSSFAGLAGTHALLERTSHVLATLSSGVGVAIAAAADNDVLEHVHFSRLAPFRVLAVVVTRSGMVRDRVLALDRDVELRELEAAGNFLNENFRSWSLERVRAELARRIDAERSEYQRLMTAAEQLWAKAVPETAEANPVYVGGVGNLIAGMTSAEERARLRELLGTLEAKQRLVDLLNAYIDSRQESLRVIFDLEEQAPELAGLVLIAAPAREAGERRGTVGVIGTKRIDYERTIGAVNYVAQVFDRMLHPSG